MRVLVLSVLTVGVTASGVASETITSTADDRVSVAVTVYNQGRGLVREVRSIDLPAGESEVRFMDVAAQIEAPTVRVAVIDGAAFSVLEQNYEYDLLSPQKLLEKFVGQTLTLVQQRFVNQSTVDREVRAKLLSTNDGTVWEIDGRIVANPGYHRIEYPSVPDNLIAHPTLVWLVKGDESGRREVEASYLTGGMSWRADYVLAIDSEGAEQGALQGWVTVDNRSGTGFENAQLQLVAGDLHRAPPQAQFAVAGRKRAMASRVEEMSEESLFEYHLYTLPRATTLKQNQTKQVRLLDASGVALERSYRLRGQATYYYSPWRPADPKEKVQVLMSFENRKSSGLGLPLPKGIVRVYQRDAAGRTQFVGEDRIDHTPKNERVELLLGSAFDIVAERRQTEFDRISDRITESAYEIVVRNHKEEAIEIEVLEPLGGDWTMLDSSHPFDKTNAFEARFEIRVPADGGAKLTYRVRVRY